MKQFKTIVEKLTNAKTFDAKINKAVNDGWTLVKRETIQASRYEKNSQAYLYAELEKTAQTSSIVHFCYDCKHRRLDVSQPPCNSCFAYNKWEKQS